MSAVADKVISIVAAIKRVAPETINQEPYEQGWLVTSLNVGQSVLSTHR